MEKENRAEVQENLNKDEDHGKTHGEDSNHKDEKLEAQEDITKLKEELEKLRGEKDKYLEMAQRRQAEFDNFRKRNNLAVSNAYKDAALETVEKLLPVLDNLERALDSVENEESPEVQSFCKGVELVTKQFIDILNKMGIKEIDALGKPFDPEYHDAVMQVESEREEDEGNVVEVLLKGYKTEDKVVRYSMVKVAN